MTRCLLLLIIFSATSGRAQVPIISLEFENYTIPEDAGNLSVIITREGDSLTSIVLKLEAKGITADPGIDFDFEFTLEEVQFLPGQTRKEIITPIIDDQLPEDDETFILSLSYSGTETVTLLLTEANVTILDDDKFEIGFDPVSYTSDEATGRVTLIINSTIPNPGPDEIILRIRTVDGTAIVREDYRNVSDFVIFAPMEQIRTYDVEIFDEEKVETILEMFFVVLEFLPDRERVPGLTLGESTATVFIRDINTVTVQLDPTSVRVDEDFGDITITIFKLGSSELNVSVCVDTQPDTATEMIDYFPMHQRLIFEPQDTENDVTIRIIDDNILEHDEAFHLVLSVPENEPVSLLEPNHIAVVNILNDDVVQFHFEREMHFIQENLESATLEVIKEGSNDIPVTVAIETQPLEAQAGEDFEPIFVLLTFEQGDTNRSISVLLIDDNIVENLERFFVYVSSSQVGVEITSPQRTAVIITNDDSVIIGFSQLLYTVGEGNSSVSVHIHKRGQNGRSVVIQLSTRDVSATEGEDYSEYSETLEIGPSFENETLTRVIPILNDGLAEPTETFLVELLPLGSGAGIESGRGEARVDIIDNDAVTVGFVETSYTVGEEEGARVQLNITKQGSVSGPVSVQYFTLSGQARDNEDFIPVQPTTVSLQEDEVFTTVSVELVNDDVVEGNEVMFVRLMLAPNDISGIQLTADTTSVIITDKDVALVGFAMQNITVQESSGEVTFHILKMGISAIQLTVCFKTEDVEATALLDYIAMTKEVTFDPSETEKLVTVELLNDGIFEGKETFTAKLTAVSSNVHIDTNAESSVIILDEDDVIVVGFEVVEMVVEETLPYSVIATVALFQGQTEKELVVGVMALNGTAKALSDFILLTSNLTFTPSDVRVPVILQIVNDGYAEFTEQVYFELVSYDDNVIIQDGNHTLLVTITDQTDFLLGFEVAEKIVQENETLELGIAVSSGSGTEIPFSITYFTMPGTAQDGKDYIGSMGNLTFAPREQRKVIQVPIIDNDILERKEEVFFVHFTVLSATPGLSVGTSIVTMTIIDNDFVVAGFEVAGLTVEETSMSEISIQVVLLQNQAERELTIGVQSVDGSAKAFDDYVPISTNLTFEPFEVFSSVPLTIINNKFVEGVEKFSIRLLSYEREVHVRDSLLITITDSRDIIFGFNQASIIIGESNGTVVLDLGLRGGAVPDPFLVRVFTTSLSAEESFDYTPFVGVYTFSLPDQQSSIEIQIINDTLLEEKEEQFLVEFSFLSDVVPVLSNQLPTIVTILDDDMTVMDDDCKPLYSVYNINNFAVVVVGFQATELHVEETMLEVVIEVALIQGRSKRKFTVGVQTMDDSATGISDYLPIATNITFEPLQSVGNVSIQIINDGRSESAEQFRVMLQSYEDAVQLSAQNSVLIVNINDHRAMSAPVCKIEDSILVTPFQGPSSSPQSYTFHGTCEHILLENCEINPSDFQITVDFVSDTLDIGRVGVKLRSMEIVILEDLSIKLTNLGDPIFENSNNSTQRFSNDIVVNSDTSVVVVELQTLGVIVTRSLSLVNLSLTGAGSLGETCGLCGDLFGSLFFSDRTTQAIISNRSSIDQFADSWRVNPGEQFLRESSKECGFVSNDTIIGDPLFTVPLYDTQGSTPILEKATNSSPPALCFEVHGASNKVFNLVSDRCTTVNALFAPMNVRENGNIIRKVGIRSIDKIGQCVDISIGLDNGCMPEVSTNNSSTVRLETMRYNSHGVSVSMHQGDRTRVSVPNCENLQLVMWVICERVNGQEMIKFVITRGINLRPTSHGLLGQFWNIPITFEPMNYTGSDLHLLQEYFDIERAYSISVHPPSSPPRSFIGELYWRSWDRRGVRCYYAGNAQGGPVRKFEQTPADSVIQGKYSDYQVANILGTKFMYSMFDEKYCQ